MIRVIALKVPGKYDPTRWSAWLTTPAHRGAALNDAEMMDYQSALAVDVSRRDVYCMATYRRGVASIQAGRMKYFLLGRTPAPCEK